MTDKKVVSITEAKKTDEDEESKESTESFDEIMKKNAAKKKREAEGRLKRNKGVLRSYRIKH